MDFSSGRKGAYQSVCVCVCLCVCVCVCVCARARQKTGLFSLFWLYLPCFRFSSFAVVVVLPSSEHVAVHRAPSTMQYLTQRRNIPETFPAPRLLMNYSVQGFYLDVLLPVCFFCVCVQLLRSSLVNNRTQAKVAEELGMQEFAITNDKTKRPVVLRTKTLADLLECRSTVLYLGFAGLREKVQGLISLLLLTAKMLPVQT